MVAVIGGADNGSFFVPSGCSHFGVLLLDFYFTENTRGFHAKKEWKALRSPLFNLHAMNLVSPILRNMCLGNLSGLLDILLVGQLVVVRTEHLHGANVAFKADLLEGICVTLVIEAVARLARPQTLLVVVVSSAARHILHAVQVPYEDLLAVGLLESLERRSHCMEMILIEGDADQRVVDLGNDVVSVLEAVDGHGRAAAELDGQLDTVRLNLLYHLLENLSLIHISEPTRH